MNTQVLELEDLDARLREAVHMPEHGPVLLTENGRPRFVIRDLTDDDVVDELLAQNPKFLESIKLARQQFAEGQALSLAEVRAKYAAQQDE
jgi:hypothetical protein